MSSIIRNRRIWRLSDLPIQACIWFAQPTPYRTGRVWKKGDRKDYYVAETDFGGILRNGLLSSVSKKLDSAKIQIERSLDLLGQAGADGEHIAYLQDQLKQAERFRARLTKLIQNPLVNKLF